MKFTYIHPEELKYFLKTKSEAWMWQFVEIVDQGANCCLGPKFTILQVTEFKAVSHSLVDTLSLRPLKHEEAGDLAYTYDDVIRIFTKEIKRRQYNALRNQKRNNPCSALMVIGESNGKRM